MFQKKKKLKLKLYIKKKQILFNLVLVVNHAKLIEEWMSHGILVQLSTAQFASYLCHCTLFKKQRGQGLLCIMIILRGIG